MHELNSLPKDHFFPSRQLGGNSQMNHVQVLREFWFW